MEVLLTVCTGLALRFSLLPFCIPHLSVLACVYLCIVSVSTVSTLVSTIDLNLVICDHLHTSLEL